MDNSSLFSGAAAIPQRIEAVRGQLGHAEERLAEHMTAHPAEAAVLSCAELAQEAGVSEATVVRVARRRGYSGYTALKLAAAREEQPRARLLHESVEPGDSCGEITEKLMASIGETLAHTRRVLDSEALTRAAEALLHAQRILVVGLGASASVATDAAHKFTREGLTCIACSDNHMQAIWASHLTSGDVVLAISHSGASRDILETLELAQSCGAATICITNYAASPILAHTDIPLFTASDEVRYRPLALASRIAQLTIIDTLYLYVAMRRDAAAVEAVGRAQTALRSKKVSQ